jgi:hypothetical protein
MRKYFLILFLLVSCHLMVLAQEAKSEVMMKMLSLKNSLIGKDSVTLAYLLADDVTYAHTNGLVQTKAQLIRSVVSGEQDYKKIDPADMNIRVYDNTAVVTMRSRVSMNYQNKPLDMEMYVTLVWIKVNRDWKLEARQSVKLN